MSIQNIQQSLESLDYEAFWTGSVIVVSRQVGGEDMSIIGLQNLLCHVRPEGGFYKVINNFGNKPDVEDFDTDTKVVAFIKEKFPL